LVKKLKQTILFRLLMEFKR